MPEANTGRRGSRRRCSSGLVAVAEEAGVEESNAQMVEVKEGDNGLKGQLRELLEASRGSKSQRRNSVGWEIFDEDEGDDDDGHGCPGPSTSHGRSLRMVGSPLSSMGGDYGSPSAGWARGGRAESMDMKGEQDD